MQCFGGDAWPWLYIQRKREEKDGGVLGSQLGEGQEGAAKLLGGLLFICQSPNVITDVDADLNTKEPFPSLFENGIERVFFRLTNHMLPGKERFFAGTRFKSPMI